MLDFVVPSEREGKRGVTEIFPAFIVKKSSDLMIKGHDFYAIWDEERGLWSTDEDDAIRIIDHDLDRYAEELRKSRPDRLYRVLHLRTANNRMIKTFHTFCKDDMRDNYTQLDEKLTFADTKVTKKDHVSKRLPYSPDEGIATPSYEKIISTLYDAQNRHKIEWSFGCILSGDSVWIQKFLVLYGPGGTGKGTMLKIADELFEGYTTSFEVESLVSNSSFPLEAFKDGPLVAIQYDGELSRIENNAKLNSIVSHEPMVINEKFKSQYKNRFKCFLLLGTNKPVRITDARSGLIRRLIDASPKGRDKIPTKEYDRLMARIPFELGGIAARCLKVYQEDPGYYNDYIPYGMINASDNFYNYVADSYILLSKDGGLSGSAAYEEYKRYCEVNNYFKLNYTIFKEELKAYYEEYEERHLNKDGTRTRSWYSGFIKSRIEGLGDPVPAKVEPEVESYSIVFDSEVSKLDVLLKDMPAQYASEAETPMKAWDSVVTKLSELDTRRLHYVRVPENHIVIDFDIPDQNGEKSFEANLEAASKFPPTYAELSKSGKGIHLHYIYSGDPSMLAYLYDEHIEIKVFTGKSSLRRKLSKCNSLDVATISSGLPLKGEKPVVKGNVISSASRLQKFIVNCMNKKYEPHATKPMVEFIYTKLEEAYASGLVYDVTNMREAIRNFALGSTHNAEYCLKLVGRMKFKSEGDAEQVEASEERIIIFDVEVFPNLFMICWKPEGIDSEVVCWINPTPEQVKSLFKYRLVGFNNRRYDNHILWAAGVGEFSPMQLYLLSQRIIGGDKDAFYRDAYNLSYTDIYDFSAVKQSLKKFEIDLKIDHKELGFRWDEPVPEDKWEEVADYCKNDVISTEAVWRARQADFAARKILVHVANIFCKSVKSTENDTTNTLTARIIFGDDKNPQSQFNYRNLGDMSGLAMNPPDDEYTLFDQNGKPIFRGYTFEKGVSTYRGVEVGEGGRVYAEPGMYGNVALLDIASMHPHSIIAEELFGPKYTKRFADLVNARIAIKHRDFEAAAGMLDGALVPFLSEELAGDLAQALKIAINSVYGLTAAKFSNPFKDPRNVDNIVAKRGALFMVNLEHEVQKRGFVVAHIKTDSIKIPDATPEIIQFVMDYGKMYGYTFEHEDTYERMCLVNDAVYIAKYKEPHGDKWWTATGTQFQVPYVFKTLFSKEPIEFDDLCETKSVTTAIYLDFNENLPEDEHLYRFVGKVGKFSPVKDGCDGGVLLREGKTGYAAVTGTKGYRWKESEILRTLGLEDQVNRDYYEAYVRDAIGTICAYGDYTWFVSDDPYISPQFVDGHPVYPEPILIN